MPEELLLRLLEAARLAPSACNFQEWRFAVVRNPETRKRLALAANRQRFISEAPVLIVCCAETDGHVMACGQQCYPIDVAIAIDHLTLCAAAEGLGTCWIGAFNEFMVKELLGVPEDKKVVICMTFGVPRTTPPARARKAIEGFINLDSYGSRWQPVS